MNDIQKTVQRANQSGSKKVLIPYNLTGPDGEEIEIGDEVVLDIVAVNKQGDT